MVLFVICYRSIVTGRYCSCFFIITIAPIASPAITAKAPHAAAAIAYPQVGQYLLFLYKQGQALTEFWAAFYTIHYRLTQIVIRPWQYNSLIQLAKLMTEPPPHERPWQHLSEIPSKQYFGLGVGCAMMNGWLTCGTKGCLMGENWTPLATLFEAWLWGIPLWRIWLFFIIKSLI